MTAHGDSIPSHRPLAVGLVVDRDLAQIEILVKIDGVLADQPQPQVWMVELDVCDQRIADVVQFALPAIVAHPAELVIDPDTEAIDKTLRSKPQLCRARRTWPPSWPRALPSPELVEVSVGWAARKRAAFPSCSSADDDRDGSLGVDVRLS